MAVAAGSVPDVVARFTMKPWDLFLGLAAVGLCLVLGAFFLHWFPASERADVGVVKRPVVPTAAAPEVVVARSYGSAQLGERMKTDDSVADDVTFLVVAALRGHCSPGKAHDLPRMAVLAGLPVLSASGGGDATQPQLARDVTAAVNDIVRQATCKGPLTLRIGAYTRGVDPETYAEAFPDSYFDPGLTVIPAEFKGVPLSQRVADSCTRVAYAMLPLDAPRAWQCAGLRGSARSRLLQLCRAEGASPDHAAVDMRNAVGRLPTTCQ